MVILSLESVQMKTKEFEKIRTEELNIITKRNATLSSIGREGVMVVDVLSL